MAAEESIPNDSCIFDPNFAIICSFFEKFSTLCGIKQHTFTELQEMIDSTEEISPQLIDLHVRLMRKAKKNVNPDRWQRTLAKFCYFRLPNDCWELEQHGYKNLNRSQRLRILLALFEAQFDHNVKFKSDVNKLVVDELRLTPFGKDKDGFNYWLHLDQDVNLKIYREDLEEEKWELIVQDREGLEKLIDDLMKERDPNRKLDDVEEEDDDEGDDEEEKEGKNEENNDQSAKDQEEESRESEIIEKESPKTEEQPSKTEEAPMNNDDQIKIENVDPVHNAVPGSDSSLMEIVAEHPLSNDEKPKEVTEINSKLKQLMEKAIPRKWDQPLTKNLSELNSKQRRNLLTPVKPLDKNSFAEHLRKLESQNMLQPLLSASDEPFSHTDVLLKSKISQKLNLIAPALHADLKKTELNDAGKTGLKITKPGLKLEQILKSKLAQKLAANNPSVDSCGCLKNKVENLSSDKEMADTAPQELKMETAESQSAEAAKTLETLKRKLCDDTDCESKNTKLEELEDEEEEEIEEPVMIVTGVGSGRNCDTGNNETGSEKSENPTTSHLTHKVEDMLKHADAEQEAASTSEDAIPLPAASAKSEPETPEKKKPKLWTIDAICNTDSKETKTRSDDVSLFPNYNFNNKEKKSNENSLFRPAETYSIFNISASVNDERDVHAVSMPTNFYFGCNNQNPCFLPAERNASGFKSHNVKDIVENLDAREYETNAKISNFNVESLCAKEFDSSKSEVAFGLQIRQNEKQMEGGTDNASFASSTDSIDMCNSKTVTVNVIEPETGNEVARASNDAPEPSDVNLGNKFEIEDPEVNRIKTVNALSNERVGPEDREIENCVAEIYQVDKMSNERTGEQNEKLENCVPEVGQADKAASLNDVVNEDQGKTVENKEEIETEVLPSKMVKCPESNLLVNEEKDKITIDCSNNHEEIVHPDEPVSVNDDVECISIPVQIAPDRLPNVETASSNEDIICPTNNKTEVKEADSTSCEASPAQNEPVIETEICERSEECVNISTPVEQLSVEQETCKNELPVSILKKVAVNKDVTTDDNEADTFDSDLPRNIDVEYEKPVVLEKVERDEDKESLVPEKTEKNNDTDTSENDNTSGFEPETLKECNTAKPDAEIDVLHECKVESHSNTIIEGVQPTSIPSTQPTDLSKADENDTYEKQTETPEVPLNEEAKEEAVDLAPDFNSMSVKTPEKSESKPVESEVVQADEEPKLANETNFLEQVNPENVISEQNESTVTADSATVIATEPEQDTQNPVAIEAAEPTEIQKNEPAIVEASTDSKLEIKSEEMTAEEKISHEETPFIDSKHEAKEEENKGEKFEEERPSLVTRISTRSTRSTKSSKNEEDSVKMSRKDKLTDEQLKDEDNKSGEIQTPVTRKLRKSTQLKKDKEEAETTPKAESKWGKKGKNQTPKSNNAEKEVPSENTETKSTKKGKNQASKVNDGRNEVPAESAEIKSTRKGKSTSNAEPRSARKGRHQKGDESADGAEVKSIKKGKNMSSKTNEVDSVEAAEARPTRKGKNQGSEEPTPASTAKATRKGKNQGLKVDDNINEGSTDNAVKTARKGKTQEPAWTKYSKKNKKSQQVKENAEEEEEVESKAENDNKDGGNEPGEASQSTKESKSKIEINDNNESEVIPQKSGKRRALKRGWLNEVDISNIEPEDGPSNIRQSRRIAQLKIKEQAEVKFAEQKTPKKAPPGVKSKSGSVTKKNSKTPVKKAKYKPAKEESDDGSTYEKPTLSKKKKKKEVKKNFDMRNAWKANSDSSSEEEEEEDHFYEEEEEIVVNDASDHEFSPESDIDDDEDYMPVKRARTAHSKPSAEKDEPTRDDLNCQRCGTSEQPEWILLCDTCDEGWHASCLKPPLLSIPEGDWFCPPCQHNKLISNLQKFLKGYEKSLKKRANEELRKKRLEYVGISISNIILDQQQAKAAKIVEKAESEKTVDSDEYTDEESEDEPSYKLRIRRQVNVSRRLNEYDELMNMAIQREDNGYVGLESEPAVGETITNLQNGGHASQAQIAEKDDAPNDENEEQNEEEDEDVEDEVDKNEKVVPPVVLQLRNVRKKPPRLTKLDVSSDDDHFSDEDFKGSSAEENDEDEYAKSETDSDEVAYRKGREPIRRSTRARVTRYDKDFINDDTDDDNEEYDQKKRKRKCSDSDSEGDSTWGKRRRSKASQSWKSLRKKRRRITFDGDSDEDRKKTRKPRVQYGLDESEDEYPLRRTRGKKINYVENLGSDSEEDGSNKKRKVNKIISDDEEYVNDEDEILPNTSKGSDVVSENGEKSESESDTETVSEQLKTNQKPSAGLDSEASNSTTSPEKSVPENADSVEANKTDFTNVCAETAEPGIAKETETDAEQNSFDASGKMKKSKKSPKKELQMYSGIMKGDSKFVIKKVDANPSLEKMHSMAQNLTETKAVPQFTPVPDQEKKYPTPISAPNAVTAVNYADVGISYEDPDGVTNEDKFARPIRVVSPSKLYAVQQEGQQQLNRPPPFAMPQRMQPPMLGAPGPMMLPRSMANSMPVRGPVPMQGAPVQGPPVQGPPMQASPVQGSRMQGSPVRGPPIQGSPVQGPPVQGSPVQGPPMSGTRMRHVNPPPNVNISQCPPVSASQPAEPVSRRGRRGRGKKQLEQERLEREAMEAARAEEMMPLHMLKLPPADMNATRPTAHYGSPVRPQYATYANVTRMSFSQAPPSTQATSMTVTMGNAPKRVKITPTRMRMPNPAQNIMRFPRPPVTSAMFVPHPHDPSPSGGGSVVAGDNKIPPVPRSTAASTMSVKSEAPVSATGMKLDHPDQYYHPTSYNTSQLPRGYNPRPEFTFVRNPMPPMYRQLQPVSSLPPVAPATGLSRPPLNHAPYPNTSSVISGPVSSSSNTSSPNVKPEVSNTPPPVPQSYPAQFPPSSMPSTTSPVQAKSNQNAVNFTTPPRTSPSGTSNANPPTSVYPGHHIKQLPPPQSSALPMPYAAPYYTTPTSVPGPYPTSQPTPLPPVSSFGPPGSRGAPPPPSHNPFKPPTSTSSSADPSTPPRSNEYLAPTTQSANFQYPETQAPATDSETENRSSEFEGSFNQSSSFEEEQPPAEESSSGEFGGLVSYFSSQREDDLDP